MAKKSQVISEPVQELSALELHAVQLVAKDAAKVRDELTVGKGQMVQCTLEICGAIDVAAAHAATVTEKLDSVTVLGVLLEPMSPPTRAKLLKQVGEACGDWADGGEPPAVSDPAREAATALLESASRKGQQPRRGAVTGSIKHTLVHRGQRQAA
jgi:hypothetical protein